VSNGAITNKRGERRGPGEGPLLGLPPPQRGRGKGGKGGGRKRERDIDS